MCSGGLQLAIQPIMPVQGTEVYMQSFGEANMWDDVLAAAGNPQHHFPIEQLTRVFVNEVINSWFGRSLKSR